MLIRITLMENICITGTAPRNSSPPKIKITSLDNRHKPDVYKRQTSPFNNIAPGAQDNSNTEVMSNLRSLNYIVDKNGCIDFPGIGKIDVKGMTTMPVSYTNLWIQNRESL